MYFNIVYIVYHCKICKVLFNSASWLQSNVFVKLSICLMENTGSCIFSKVRITTQKGVDHLGINPGVFFFFLGGGGGIKLASCPSAQP